MFGNVNDKQYPCICENGMYVTHICKKARHNKTKEIRMFN